MSVSPESFFAGLKARGVRFFTGVPDSLLSSLGAYIEDNTSPAEHVIAANEGNAVALAVGYHLATGGVPVVYLQNSGLGNTINPITSLADKEVYRIPMLMIVGWRGEPGIKDEPQHIKQGRITPGQLQLLEVPYWILDASTDADTVLSQVFAKVTVTGAPIALLVRKDAFGKYKLQKKQPELSNLTREDAIRHILVLVAPGDLVVSTTGKASREVYELREERGEAQCDFLTVGGMGHTASIALGVALGRPDKRVVCIDGDGSVLMHMGALPIIGSRKPNLIHVLLNNAAHESVGGQPTVAAQIDFKAIALASGYAQYEQAASAEQIAGAWDRIARTKGPCLLEVKISRGARDNLGRPKTTPEENKLAFCERVRS